jgi:hypothetical protein
LREPFGLPDCPGFQGGESLFFGGDLAPSVIRRHPSTHRFDFCCVAIQSRPALLHG